MSLLRHLLLYGVFGLVTFGLVMVVLINIVAHVLDVIFRGVLNF